MPAAVTDVVRRYVPSSYKAMIVDNNDYYTLAELQSIADYVKLKLLGTIVDATLESSVYDPLLTDFLGKVTVLQFIPAAIDYWADQLTSETATGTNESRSYPDRIASLERTYSRLSAQVRNDFKELAPIYGFIIRRTGNTPDVSYGDNGRGILITPDPQCWDLPWNTRDWGGVFPWS